MTMTSRTRKRPAWDEKIRHNVDCGTGAPLLSVRVSDGRSGSNWTQVKLHIRGEHSRVGSRDTMWAGPRAGLRPALRRTLNGYSSMLSSFIGTIVRDRSNPRLACRRRFTSATLAVVCWMNYDGTQLCPQRSSHFGRHTSRKAITCTNKRVVPAERSGSRRLSRDARLGLTDNLLFERPVAISAATTERRQLCLLLAAD